MHTPKKILPLLKNIGNLCIAIGIGYITWNALVFQQLTTTTISVPLYVYNLPPGYTADISEYIPVTIQGSIPLINALNSNSNTYECHLNLQKTDEGTHIFYLKHAHLFLPKGIKLVDYVTQTVTVKISKIEKDSQLV